MIALAIPLTQPQLDAANRLHAHLRQWRVTDDALTALACAFPAWEPEAALLKVAAVNQLYGTNLYAVVRMAEHVSAVMVTAQPAAEGQPWSSASPRCIAPRQTRVSGGASAHFVES